MSANLSDKLKSDRVSIAGYAANLATEQRKTAELVSRTHLPSIERIK